MQCAALHLIASIGSKHGREIADALANTFLRLRTLGVETAVQWLKVFVMPVSETGDLLQPKNPHPAIKVLFKRRFSSCFLVAVADFVRMIASLKDAALLEQAIATAKTLVWWRSGGKKGKSNFPSPESFSGKMLGQVEDLVAAIRLEF